MTKSKKIIISVTAAALVVVIALTIVLVSIFGNRGNGNTAYDNETTPLVFSSQEVDKVFNPFFSTNAADSSVVGMTQIGMLTNDEKGNPVYGDEYPVVTKDMQIVTEGETEDVDLYTTYYFVLKNDVKFSDGKPLTIKDVLFNLYVYLDPVYTGSSTIYSTDIVGLKEYRTQETDETEQDAFDAQFEQIAADRLRALRTACNDINDTNSSYYTMEFEDALVQYASDNGDYYENILEDYKKACELFRKELETDYTNSTGSDPKEIKFYDKENNKYEGVLTKEVEVFLLNTGLLSWDKKYAKLTSKLVTEGEIPSLKDWTKEQAIQRVYDYMMPANVLQVISYWMTATELYTYITNAEKEKFFSNEDEVQFKNISGIQFANRTKAVTINGKEYGVPTYNEDGSVKSGNEVLSIKIRNIDPKAIWNFSLGIAPMHYYSSYEVYKDFDFETNFGVKRGNQTFMETVVKNPDKIGVPVGAGAYAASKSSGGISNISAGEFYNNGVIYFERNPYFVLGPAKIKKVRYQVVSSAQMLNSLYNGEIDYATPNAKVETVQELNGKKNQGIQNKSVRTMGYGYIGINAGKVPDLAVRQAIMHCVDTQECVDYYRTTASIVHRPMSRESWAYPKNATAYYPYIAGKIPENLDVVNPDYAEFVTENGYSAGQTLSKEHQEEFIRTIIEDCGYNLNSDDVYTKTRGGNHTLKYTFTIAGEETDHPAWDAMYHASELLNAWGFDVTVTTDAQALSKLSKGELTVWAAAWGSTIDPDMYQVYHKDSKASSVNNWGYPQIKIGKDDNYSEEWDLIEELSEYIDAARKIDDSTQDGRKARADIYSDALDIVMQLAIELPTYQRDDLFAYNAKKLDESSLNKNISAFKGLTSDLHLVSLVTEK
ncbi:MAG: hypothetical protein E7360_04955 [Clostridiales bacterium]|nr:hypothetical protein [Clostridiales bacterium]